MSEPQRILVAIDDSEAAQAALRHCADLYASAEAEVRLFHVVGPIPPSLLEHGGAGTREEEERVEHELDVLESKWFAEKKAAAEPMLEAARDTLVAGGIAAERISVHLAKSLPEDRLAHLILEDARESGCQTVVVGHTSYGWLRQMFHSHLPEQLHKHGAGLTIVVVE